MVSAPATTPPRTAASPTAPAPKIARLEPGCTSSELSTAPAPLWMPQPSGANTFSGRVLSTTTTLRLVAMACVANDDCANQRDPTGELSAATAEVEPSARQPIRFRPRDAAHSAGRWAVQFRHCPHEANVNTTW